jgi:tRNA(Ile2) C34 agmatinyltransferase TiaS
MGGAKKDLLDAIRSGLEKYSVSDETGMVAFSEFDAEGLMEYSRLCRSKMITKELTLKTCKEFDVEICIDGKGIIGALAALPWFSLNDESVML